MKRVLMIAYHFPPLSGSSGIQRTLRFVQQLPALGWDVTVLTAHPRAYESVSGDLMPEIPREVAVERAFALDTARHLAVAGRYPAFLACPDRWVTWRLAAVPLGLRIIRTHRPDVLWSTFPIASAHAIAQTLHRRSGVPWIADFRDPMAQEGYPENRRVWRSFKQIEERAIDAARCSVFTTPGAADMYRERYPARADRISVIENGYDEESFADLEEAPLAAAPIVPGAMMLLHSGIVYPSERDPTALFAAMGRLAASGFLVRGRFQIRFRAAGHDELLRQLTRKHALEAFVEILPSIAYRDALREMFRADGLLVLQAANCNQQIPAKVYEYLRARRPILALTDPAGDTARLLRDAGVDMVGRLDSADDIAIVLRRFIEAVRSGNARLPGSAYVASASRRARTRSLAALLGQVSAPR